MEDVIHRIKNNKSPYGENGIPIEHIKKCERTIRRKSI